MESAQLAAVAGTLAKSPFGLGLGTAAGALALVPPRGSRATTPSAAMDAAVVGGQLQQHIAHIAEVENFSLVPTASTLLPTAGVSSELKSAWFVLFRLCAPR